MLYLILAHYCICYLVVWFMRFLLVIVTKINVSGWLTAQAGVLAVVTMTLHYSLHKLGFLPLMVN